MYPVQLELDGEQTLFADTCRTFLDQHHPVASVRETVEQPRIYDRARWRDEARLGWFGLLAPEAVGGGSITGTGVSEAAVVAAELGSVLHPGPVIASMIAARVLGRAGDPAAVATARSVVEGSTTAIWALGNPAWLWADGRPDVTATLTGDAVVLRGTLTYVSDAGAADVLVVTAGVDGEPDRLVQAMVPADTIGVRVRTLESLDLTRTVCHVDLDGVGVGPDAVLTRPAPLRDAVVEQFDLAALLQSVESVGAIDRVFDLTLRYAQDRVAFGRPIGSYQAIKHRLADLLVGLESCKATVGAAIRAAESGSPDTSHLVSVAASYVGDTAPRLVQECVQVHGGIGLTWEHDLHLYLRRVTTDSALLGTPAAHRRRLDRLLT